MKKLNVLLVLALAALMAAAALPALAAGNSGTTLIASKTAVGRWERTFHWAIDKSVAPDTWNLFKGDSGTSTYTIRVTKDAGTDRYFVDGAVCVKNGGAVATDGLSISDEILYSTGGGGYRSLKTTPVSLGDRPVLQPGESKCYPYSIDFTPVAGASYKNTAHVSILNHSGSLGTPKGPDPSAEFTLPGSPTLINNTINVDDSNGSSWAFSASGSQPYTRTFACDGDKGAKLNTATIRETGQSDSATVQVNCFGLNVTKDAATSFDRTYSWSIDKSADKSALTLPIGQTSVVNYSVAVNTTGYTDAKWAVSGNIYVKNPAPIAAVINSVSDLVSGVAGAAPVTCGVTFPYQLAAGGTLNCTYTLGLPDAADRTNTATAELQNHSYAWNGTSTELGTTSFSGSADVRFANATINEIDECVNVTDAGSLGTVCAGETLAKTFTYSRTVGSYGTCGQYSVPNTAIFTTNDTGTSGSDTWTVAVNVPCAVGCTLTQGYWGTHSKYGPAKPDANWDTVGEDTTFFQSGTTWYGAITTAPQGNGYWILSNQYVAAVLNQKKGTSVQSGVQAALDAATAWFTTAVPGDCSTGGSCGDQKGWAETLTNYNEGKLGVPHCG